MTGASDPRHDLQQVIDRWLATLASPHTRSAYRTDVGVYLRWCAAERRLPLAPESDTLDAFRDHGLRSVGPATVARRSSAVNALLRYADADADADAGPDAPHDEPSASRPPRGGAGSTGSIGSTTVGLVADQRDALLATTTGTTRLLVALLLLDGLKLDEVLRLDVADVVGRPPAVRLALDRPGAPTVRLHPVTGAAAAAHVRGRPDADPLLVSASRTEPAGSRLSRFGADYLLRQAGRRAGFDAPLTSNVLRRTHAEHARANGDSGDQIARRMGHDDLRSTRRYLSPTSPTSPTSPGAGGSRRRPNSQEV